MPEVSSLSTPDMIVTNAKVAGSGGKFSEALAITNGHFSAVGTEKEVMVAKGAATQVIDARGRVMIPGLHDSHIHLIRGGLNYTLELRWDGVPSLADGLRMLKEQAQRTPPGQWVRVVGGWTEFQFAERRMPTLEEINAVSPDVPVFVLHLYDRAILNKAALRVLGYGKDTPEFPGAEIQRDKQGNPTGLLIARPNALILYATLAKGPKLPYEQQVNSSRHFMRELNRFGITSVIDAGGGFQNYPEDYKVVEDLHRDGQLTVRIAYNLFTQRPKQELDDFSKWVKMTQPGAGDEFYRMNGAGEMLVFSAADFEDFLEPRPDLAPNMEEELKQVVRLLAEHRWPFRLHATYNESITRFLNVFEEVNREIPFNGMRWFFDHAETISPGNIDRVKALGGGIAVQDRMAFQGEYFFDRYGAGAAEETPPIRRMLRAGLPIGAGTDATRVSSYNPFLALYWLVTGKTAGGLGLYSAENRLDRAEALRLYTQGSAWFSSEEQDKGAIAPGKLADFALLTEDYFSVPDEQIKNLEAVLTVVGGKVVYARDEFAPLGPPSIPVLPDWSPVGKYGGYGSSLAAIQQHVHSSTCGHPRTSSARRSRRSGQAGIWNSGCDCWAF